MSAEFEFEETSVISTDKVAVSDNKVDTVFKANFYIHQEIPRFTGITVFWNGILSSGISWYRTSLGLHTNREQVGQYD